MKKRPGLASMTAIYRRELLSYLTTPTAYVFVAVFLFAIGLFTFQVGGFFEARRSDLSAFFTFHWHRRWRRRHADEASVNREVTHMDDQRVLNGHLRDEARALPFGRSNDHRTERSAVQTSFNRLTELNAFICNLEQG